MATLSLPLYLPFLVEGFRYWRVGWMDMGCW
ncbi:hypothetical protein CsSME_00010365 [Camellia sinensis var. sinensis]